MDPAQRYGSAIRFDATRTIRHDNGWIDLDGVATLAGVSDYVGRDGSVVRELKHPEDLFDGESLASLVGVPFTDDHPSTPLDARNTRHYARGSVLEQRRDGELLRVRVRVTDEQTANAIESGKVELSPGFTARVVPSAGVYNGDRFDARQTEIRYNHLALVDTARAGPEARLRLDSARIEREDQAVETETVIIAGIEYTVPAAVAQTLVALEGRVTELAAQIEAMTPDETTEDPEAPVEDPDAEPVVEDTTEAAPPAPEAAPAPAAPAAPSKPAIVIDVPRSDAGEDRFAALTARLDHLEATAGSSARARGKLEREASRILPAAFRYDEADDCAVMAATIVSVHPKLEQAVEQHRADASYLRPLFDLAVAEHSVRTDSTTDLAAAVGAARVDSAKDPITDARSRYLDRLAGKAAQA